MGTNLVLGATGKEVSRLYRERRVAMWGSPGIGDSMVREAGGTELKGVTAGKFKGDEMETRVWGQLGSESPVE